MYEIKLLPAWDSDVEYYMQESLQGANVFFEKQVNSGLAQLWQVDHGDTYFITRIEKDKFGRRILVVCCFEGCDIQPLYQLIERVFFELGAVAVRYHTRRKGMIRLGLRHGFQLLEKRDTETVMIKYLK